MRMARGDRWLLILPLALTALGVIMVYSSSSILGMTRFDDSNYFFSRQAMRALLGVIVLLVVARLELRWVERAAPVLFGIAAVLLLVVAVAGQVSNGASRWLRLGFLTMQPTDFGRLALVILLAWWLKRRPPAELGFTRGLLPPLGIILGAAGLILLQPNLSSAALLGVTGLAVLFLSGARLAHLMAPVAAGSALAAFALTTHPYMMLRLKTFLTFVMTGQLDERGSGWQLDQSLIAIGSGGWLGRGIGDGLQKYFFLPEAHTDFIYSIYAEEAGFIGSTLLVAALLMLVWRGMRTTMRAQDPFAQLLAGGLTIQLGLYAIANLAVATGLAPTTGLPLPFVSYGGSALLANMAAAGLLYAISTTADERATVVRRSYAGTVTA